MKMLRLHISNLNSIHTKVDIDFTASPLVDAGIFAITGDTGSGKTTILDAITLALYGKIARNDKPAGAMEVMSFGATECQAELEFATDDARYLAIWRMHRARGKVDGALQGPRRELAKWDEEQNKFIGIEDKKSEVSGKVEQVTGLDYNRFTRSVLLSQGDFAAFLKATDRDRSGLLERITGTEIYSEISIAAFNRHKIEEQELKEIQRQLHQLDQFEEEPVDEEAIKELEGSLAKLQKELTESRKTKNKYDRWKTLQQKTLTLAEEKQQIQENELAFEANKIRLEAARKLRPLHKNMDEYKSLTQQKAALKIALTQLGGSLNESEKSLKVKGEELLSAEAKLLAHKQTSADTEKTLQQADALDIRLETARKALSLKLAAQKEQEQILKTETQKVAHLEASIKNIHTEKDKLQNWLNEHVKFEELAIKLPVIEQQRLQLLTLFQQGERVEADIKTQQANLLSLTKAISQEEKKLQNLNQALTALASNFGEQLPTGFDLSKEEALQRLSTEIENLQEQRQMLRDLSSIDTDYQNLLKEQDEYQEQLQNLLSARHEITKKLLTIVEIEEDFEPQLQYKRKIYKQQQSLANYQKDRQNLLPGEPCPLCLSTDHPFHEHPPEPFVDEAKLDLEKAEQQFETFQVKKRLLLRQDDEFQQEQRLLQGGEQNNQEGLLAKQNAKIEAYEAKMAAILKITLDTNTGHGKALQHHLDNLDLKLKDWKSARAKLSELLRKQESKTEESQQIQQDLAAKKAKQEAATEQLEERIALQLDQQEKFEISRKELDNLLGNYGYTFDLKTAKSIFADLRKIGETYQQNTKQNNESNRQLELAKKEYSLAFENLNKLKETSEKETIIFKEEQQAIEELQTQRQSLFAEPDTEKIRFQLRQHTAQFEQAVQHLQQSQNQLREKTAADRQSLKENTDLQTKTSQQLETLHEELSKKVVALGYQQTDDENNPISQAEMARMTHEEETVLEQQAQKLTLRQSDWKRVSEETAAELEKLATKTFEELEEQQLLENIQQQEEKHTAGQLQLGQFTEQLKQQQKRKKQHQNLLEAAEDQRKSYNRWHQLNEMIGQADGKKFRTFAQGLTLQKLVALANRHLQQLDGRYRIHKKEEEDLALEIIDTFQADNRRSMYTLSGGETFLVSLALALGLSDLAGRHANIQSLFIDEGFGTLDENSLDLALSTLENLQSSGKVIGLISHVPLLKERIATQIQVQKQSSGFSTVQLVG